MGRIDRYIVPGTVVIAMLVMFFVTAAWIKHPTAALQWHVTMGPPGIRPDKVYGLRFTPRNLLSGHSLHTLVPLTKQCPRGHRQCVDVTITNRALTYLDRKKAIRLPDGSYKLPYRFPHADDYVLFVEMQPKNGDYQAYRETVNLSHCSTKACKGEADLRGKESIRSQRVDGLTVVLGAPIGPAISGTPARVALTYLRNGQLAQGIKPVRGGNGDAVAISIDSQYFVRLHVDKSHTMGGAITYTGVFDHPSIYRIWAPATDRRHHTLRASFVLDVNPAPPPTPRAE